MITDERHEIDSFVFGLVDTRTREDEEFFYGVQVQHFKASCREKAGLECSETYTRTTLPVWFGFEVKGNSWLTFRSFIRQNFWLDEMKDSVGYAVDSFDGTTGAVTEYTAGPNSTEIASGLGIHLGQVTIDGVFKGFFGANQNQNIDMKDFLTSISLTYNY